MSQNRGTRSKTARGTMFHLRNGAKTHPLAVRIDAKGYLVFKAGFFRDTRLHRIVATAIKGRDLTQDEDVHHENGRKLDCEPDNLKVMGKAEHGWGSAVQHWFVPRILAQREKDHWDDYFDNSAPAQG
jgi:HNH endonuclease